MYKESGTDVLQSCQFVIHNGDNVDDWFNVLLFLSNLFKHTSPFVIYPFTTCIQRQDYLYFYKFKKALKVASSHYNIIIVNVHSV